LNSSQPDKLPEDANDWDDVADLSEKFQTTSFQPPMFTRLTKEFNLTSKYPPPPDFDINPAPNNEVNSPPSKKLQNPMFIIDKKPDQAAQKKIQNATPTFFN